MAQLMPLPLTVFCFTKIQIGFIFLVPLARAVPDKGPLNARVFHINHSLIGYITVLHLSPILKQALQATISVLVEVLGNLSFSLYFFHEKNLLQFLQRDTLPVTQPKTNSVKTL